MDASQILESPDYINANPATKRAIFDKHIAAMPDYAKANAATQTAIRQRFGLAEEKPSFDLADVPGQALVNAPASAAKFAGDIYTAVTNPVQTVTGLADLAAGSLRAGAKAVLPAQVFQFIDQIDNPETTKRISDVANAVGGQLAQDYGSFEGIKRKVATDPVAFVADMSTLLTGGALATARVAPATSNMLARAATATDPLMQTARAGMAGVNALRAAPGAIQSFVPRALEPLVAPEAVAVNRIIEAGGGAEPVLNALRQTQNMPVTPGAPSPSLSERMIAGGAPSVGLAKLEAGVAANAPEAGQQIFQLQQQRLSAIQEQLARIDDYVKTQAANLTPEQTAQVKLVRDDLLRNLAAERAVGEARAGRVAATLPDTGQAAPGGAIQERGAALAEEFKKQTIQPAFRAAFDADAPAPSIDLSRPLASAERLLGEVGTIIDPSTVSPGVRNLLKIEPYEPSLGVAPVVSLEDFQSIRSALGKQARAVADTDRVRAAGIRSVIQQMDEALKTSGVPAEAQKLYGEARRLVREEQLPRFRTGETGRMLSETRFNMPGTRPSETVPSFLKTEEGASQFVRTFERDPQAVTAMRTGVADWLRESSRDPATGFLNPARMEQFLADYGRQLDTLDAGSGTSLRPVLEGLRAEAAKAQSNLDALAADTARMKKPRSAKELVDVALKSPVEMDFIRQRLSPGGREAMSQEIQNRATRFINAGDPDAALKFLNENRKTIRTGLGKDGAKVYADLRGLAEFQRDLAAVAKQAPKTDILTPVQLSRTFTPAELTDLKVVADDLKRMRQVEELGTPPDRAAKQMGSEQAAALGTRAADAPAYFTPVYTTIKKAVQKLEERVNRKAVAYAVEVMYRDPDKLIPLLEDAIALKGRTARPAPLTIPVGVERGARALTGAGVAGEYIGNSFAPQENRNSMVR